MTKLIKKYRNWIMVGGGSVLMVMWLLPAGSSSGSGGRTVWATLDGTKIRVEEYNRLGSMYQAIQHLTDQGVHVPLKSMGCSSVEHFVLLQAEADRQGLIGGAADVEELFERMKESLAGAFAQQDMSGDATRTAQAQDFFAAYQASDTPAPEVAARRRLAQDHYFGLAQERMFQIRARVQGGLRDADFERAMASYRGILRMFENYFKASRPSDRRVINVARRENESATVDYVLVKPDNVLPRIAEPTAEEIAAHYEQYKNVEPRTGDHGIGYRKPNRIKIEWIELNKSKTAEAIKLVDTHVRERWNAANPGKAPTEFAKDRAAFESQLRATYAEEIIRVADTRFREIAGEANRAYPADGRYRKLPENWREGAMPLQKLADQIVAGVKSDTTAPDERERWKSPVEFPAPYVHAETAWMAPQDLAKLEGLGRASLTRGGLRPLDFPTVALDIREFNPTNSQFVQMGVVPVFDRPLSDVNGNVYYVRITATRPAGEPESIDEVREDVIKDIKRLKAFELIKTTIADAAKDSLTGGLDAVSSKFTMADTITTQKLEPAPVRRGLKVSRQQVEPSKAEHMMDFAQLNDASFRDPVLAQSLLLDSRIPAGQQPADARTVWAILPKSMCGVVARIEGVAPVTIEEIRLQDRTLLGAATAPEAVGTDPLSQSPYTYESLRRRLNFHVQNEKNSTEKTSAEKASTEKSPG